MRAEKGQNLGKRLIVNNSCFWLNEHRNGPTECDHFGFKNRHGLRADSGEFKVQKFKHRSKAHFTYLFDKHKSARFGVHFLTYMYSWVWQ